MLKKRRLFLKNGPSTGQSEIQTEKKVDLIIVLTKYWRLDMYKDDLNFCSVSF